MCKMFVKTLPAILILLHVLFAHAQVAVNWTQVHPGIWKAVVGKPESISLLKAAGVHAYEKGFASLPSAPFPLDKKGITVSQRDGKIYLRFPLEREERIFGFGLNFQTVNQRGRVLQLHVDHYGGTDNGRTHAPAPFYVSSNGYGVLVDAARYMTVYAGTAVRVDTKDPPKLYDRNTDKDWDAQPYSDAVEILVPAQGAELYVFAGPTPMNVVQRYNLMNGGGCLPPKWGLGFTERMPTLSSQTDIVNEAKLFEQHDFPLDVIGVEPGWQSTAYPCTFEWNKKRFPDPQGFVKELSAMGVRANLWTNPYISPRASLYPSMKSLSGSHTVWNGLVPDLTLPGARKLLKEHFLKYHVNIGISGYKIDEIDGFDKWLWPDVATFPSGYSGEQMRQVYGLLAQRMTTAWFRERNQRTYGLIRASNAGASSFPYVIYDDYYSHRDFITALINSSFAGVLWTPEVRASETAEEWVRRMQSVCFSPMAMLNAWADGTKPWSFPEVEKAVKDVASLRMQLIPYLYSTFAQYRFEGKPPFRAMNLVEGAKFIDFDLKDQYMVGDYILVAPMFAGEKSRKVYLPRGKWYDFYTGALAGENEVITVTPGLDKIPLYVKDGGIIPMIDAQRHAPSPTAKDQLIVRHYGHADGSFMLYDDDGVSFNYERGECSFVKLSVVKGIGSMTAAAATKPFAYLPDVKWVFMSPEGGNGQHYELVWDEEFNYTGKPDSTRWGYEYGFVRNHELQWYQPENANCRQGKLFIQAKREKKVNPAAEYTSSCITTKNKASWQYGRFEMRGRISIAAGLWPAWWTLGVDKPWPNCGEVDVMEYYRGKLLANILGTRGENNQRWYSNRYSTDSLGGKAWASQFHVWRMDWTADDISLYIDDHLLNKVAVDSLLSPGNNLFNPYRQPHYMLVNLAIGGDNGGDPAATPFPQDFEVDYIRVYQVK